MEWSERGFRGDRSRSFENSALVALARAVVMKGRAGSQYFLLSSPLLKKRKKG